VAESLFEEVRMEALTVAANSRAAGSTLAELSPSQTHHVQIAGINRGGLRILNPKADERVRAGDELLALGAPVSLRDFKSWLREPAA
jgi:CPA2 family monovalent cation:H+ antiporter-2